MRKSLYFVLTLAIMQLPVFASNDAHAASNPTITLISPAAGSTLVPDAPFTITVNIVGGWASSANDCSISGNDRSPDFHMVQEDANGNARVWVFKSVFSPLFSHWKAKIIPNGIQCSVTTFSSDYYNDGYWRDIDSTVNLDKEIFALSDSTPNNIGPITKIIMSVGFYGVNGYESQQKITFNAGKSAQPEFSFVGISRGDTFKVAKTYTVRMTMGSTLTFEGNSESSFRSTGACSNIKKVSETSTTKTYEKNCIITAYDLVPGESTVSVSAEVFTAQGGDYKSDPVVLNIEVPEFPLLALNIRDMAPGKNSGTSKSYQFVAEGMFYLASPLKASVNMTRTPNQELKICVNGSCDSVKTDENGDFTYSKEVKTSTVNWSISGEYKGWKIVRNSLVDWMSSNQQDDLDLGPIIGTVNSLPQGNTFVAPPINIRITQVLAPSKVKWGNSFSVTVKATGKGTARCEIRYQPTMNNGRYGFVLTAGKTSKITIKPWYYKLAAWPLSVVCIPNNWPSENSHVYISYPIAVDAGTVTLTN